MLNGMQERVDRCDKIFGRNSWGFAHSVDPQDVTDLQSSRIEMPDKDEAVFAAAICSRAFYGTWKYGDPYVCHPVDAYLKKIDRLQERPSCRHR